MNKIILAVLGVMVASGAAGQAPHSKLEVGRIEGRLVKDGKPLAEKEVVIQVEQDGQTLLTLPKKTDEQGQFVFKNIFKDPQYRYFLLTEYEGKVYRHGPLQLLGKQESLKTVFAITPDKMVEMAAEPLPPESPRAAPSMKPEGQWQHYQVVAVLLAVMVLVVLAYNLGRYQRKK